MAFLEQGSVNYRDYKTLSKGDVVAEGWIEGFSPNTFNAAKRDVSIRERDGSVVKVNSCGSLEYKLKEAKPAIAIGDYVKIVYEGEQVMEKGSFKGKSAHTVKVFRDADLHIDSQKLPSFKSTEDSSREAAVSALDDIDL
jgi:hypothetical protein